jgi:hypothetical protein
MVFLLSLAVYAFTAQRGVSWQDSGEFQYRVLAGDYLWISGIARAHPLYILAARGFCSLFSQPRQFYALNLFSGVGMSVALAFLALILWTLTRNTWAVLIAVLTLGLAHMAWWMSTIAEVYTWSAAFLMAEIFCLLKVIGKARDAAGEARGSGEAVSRAGNLGWWIALLAINGLHASLHNFAFLNLPVYAVLFVTRHVKQKAGFVFSRILICLLSWLAGAALLVGLFILEWRATGSILGTFKSVLFGREFEQVVLGTRTINWHLAAMNLAFASVSLLNPCWLFVGYGWTAAKSHKPWGRCLLGLTAIHFTFWIRYFVADQATFVLPVLSLLAIWLGCGFATRKLSAFFRAALAVVAISCSVIGPVLLREVLVARQGGVVRPRTLPFRDETRYWLLPWKHNERSAEHFIKEVRSAVREHDVLIADNTAAGPVVAMREAGRLPRNMRVIAFFTGETDDEQVRIAATRERVYLVSPVPGYASAKLLDGRFKFEREGVLYRVIDTRRKTVEGADE